MDVNTGHTGNTGHPYWSDDPDRLGAEMTRGWPYERRPIQAVDSTGKPIKLYVGLAHDAEGKLQMTVGAGDVRNPDSGPTVMLGSINGAELLGALGVTYADYIKRGGS